jgi:hypothetical protein
MGIKRCRPISFIQPVPSQPYIQLGNEREISATQKGRKAIQDGAKGKRASNERV